MKTRRLLSLMLAICLCLTALPAVTIQAEAAGYYRQSDLSGIKSTILSNSERAGYVNYMMQYHILSSNDNYRVARNLESGKSVIFFFDGCSDYVDDPVYGNFNKYHLSAYCAVVRKVDGALKIVFESENCSTIPDNPRDPSLNGNTAVPTVLDGVYNIISTNHKGRYAALRIADYSGYAPAIRCNWTSSYISSSGGINIHTRRAFPDVPPGGFSATSYNSTGCFNVGLPVDGWSEYNRFIETVMGISNAIITTPEADGVWTQCYGYVDQGIVVVDRTRYKSQLEAIYGGDGTRTAKGLVSLITAYTDQLNVTVPSYTVKYDANGGTGAPASQKKHYNVPLTLQNGALTRDEHTFMGWSTNKNALFADYQPGDSYTPDKNATMYAVWKSFFQDVANDSWQFGAAKYAYDNHLMSGKGKDRYDRVIFDPNSPITREEFVQVLYNASGKPSVGNGKVFPDVEGDRWYIDAVCWATAWDIASGMGNGDFGIGVNISRQDLAVMLYKYAGLKEIELVTTEGRIDAYGDGSEVSGYAKEAMDWAVTNGVLNGKGNKGEPLSNFKLDPAGTATRAECAAMMKNFVEAFGL